MKRVPLTQSKICSACSESKSVAEFNRWLKSADGLQRTCRDCQRAYRIKTKAHRLEYNRKYQKNHPEVNRKSNAKYRALHREKVLETARQYARRVRKENPEEMHKKDRRWAMFKNYGISLEQYDEILQSQNGLCAICQCPPGNGNGRYLCIDHDHSTGGIRGLLCRKCNAALGLVSDSPETLNRMIAYLARTNQQMGLL